MASRLEELLKKLGGEMGKEGQEKKAEEVSSSEKEEGGIVKLSEEDLELLQALGAAYINGLIAGLQKSAEDEMMEEEPEEGPEVVDLDGDGIPDHIVADPQEVAEELAAMVEEGEISPEEAEEIADALAAQLEGSEEEPEEEEVEEKTAQASAIKRIFKKLTGMEAKEMFDRSKVWRVKGSRKGQEVDYIIAKNVPEGVRVKKPSGAGKNVKGWEKFTAMATRSKEFRNKLLIPVAFYGGTAATLGGGYAAYRATRSK